MKSRLKSAYSWRSLIDIVRGLALIAEAPAAAPITAGGVVVAGGDAYDALQFGNRLRQRLRERDPAAAGVGVDERRRLGREEIAEVRQPLLGKHNDQIAVGVAAAEVVELDAIVAIEQRHAVGHHLVRQELRVRAAEGSIFSIRAFAFAWAMIVVAPGNSTLPPT